MNTKFKFSICLIISNRRHSRYISSRQKLLLRSVVSLDFHRALAINLLILKFQSETPPTISFSSVLPVVRLII